MSSTAPAFHLSKRLAQIEPSATVGMAARVAKLRAQGVSVISFSQGEPDFDTPAPIKAAAIDAIERNMTHYTPTGGTTELKRAIAQQVERESGIAYTPAQISTTTGAKEALYLAFQALVDAGDEVIIPGPYWVSYVEQVRLAGATPVVISADESTGFKITAEQLAAHLTPNTRAIILNSPSNPTGAVYSDEELRALADVLRDTDVVVLTDEIYAAITYTGECPRWLRVAPDFADRTLVINGASKAYAMTGWRFGYVAGPAPLIEAISNIQGHSTTHTSSITQAAALAAYTPSDELTAAIDAMVRAFRERRDLIGEALSSIPGVRLDPVPDGAFYVFPNVEGLLNRPLREGAIAQNSSELADYLLDQGHIGVVAGEAFGAPGYIRLSYATSNANISEGMRRFAEAVV